MRLWIDINDPKYVPFYKLLCTELKHRGHEVILTAQDSANVKKTLEEYKFNAKVLGKFISFFGLLEYQANLWRSAVIYDYLINRKIDIAFSLGSSFMAYNCTYLKIPLVLFFNNLDKKIHWTHFYHEKAFFIVSSSLLEKLLLDKGISKKKIIICKFIPNIDNPEFKSIEEFCSSIEALNNFRDLSA